MPEPLWTDYITAVAAALSCIIILVSALLALRELRLNRKVHTDNHDWHRRIAAQAAIVSRGDVVGEAQKLDDALGFVNATDPLLLEDIHESFSGDPELRNICHRLLNYYEMLARGVYQGIYDEEIIRDARRYPLTNIWNAFSIYIKHRRKDGNPTVWERMEDLASKWKREERASQMRGSPDKGRE